MSSFSGIGRAASAAVGQGGEQRASAGRFNSGILGMAMKGLPPTGLQQQAASAASQMQPQGQATMQPPQGGAAPDQPTAPQAPQAPQAPVGAGGSLNQLAQNLAQRYGLPVGREALVDDQGNFLMTPDQVAKASGGRMSMGDAAARMNYISQAINKQQQSQSRAQGVAAMQTGLGLVQSRGRGSLATMQSGMYQQLAQMYESRDFERADFSYYIQQDLMNQQKEMMRKAEKKRKKGGVMGAITGGLMLGAGVFTGNPMLIAQGAGGVMAGGQQAGWF